MSFGGPPPTSAAPSGPFEETITMIASSPYTMATAIFLINVGGRFLPMEITKEQEKFLNQPWFRRSIIFVILFLATRNFITAGWMALIIILFIGYLFNENSDLYLFSKAPGTKQTTGDTIALTPEEQLVLKTLQDKAAKVQDAAAKPIKLDTYKGAEKHKQYKNVLRSLWNQISRAN